MGLQEVSACSEVRVSEAEVFRGDGCGQPDAIVGAPEGQPVRMHCGGVHPQHHRATMPGANLDGGFLIWRQVDVLAAPRLDAAREDRIKVIAGRAVEQCGRWLGDRQAQIDGNRMPLCSSNTAAVFREREPLFVVVDNDLAEPIRSKPMSCLFHTPQELVHLDPSSRTKRQPNKIRFMAQDT